MIHTCIECIFWFVNLLPLMNLNSINHRWSSFRLLYSGFCKLQIDNFRGSDINSSPEQILEGNAKEKKRQYCRRVLEVENATFSPLIFTTNGGMGRECQVFYNRLAQELARKWQQTPSQTIAWMRTRLSFALCRSTHMCIRGSSKWKEKVPVEPNQVEMMSSAQ